MSLFFFLQIKSFGIHIKIYYLGFLSVIAHTKVGVEKRLEDKHEDSKKKKPQKRKKPVNLSMWCTGNL